MADYYPLIARAIAGLDPAAPGESRRALYERARTALISQLRSVQPPLSESEITRERLSLEEAVRKVESEAAQRAREARAGGRGGLGPGDALRRANGRPGDAASSAAGSSAPRPRPAAPPPLSAPPSRNDRAPLGQDERPARNARGDTPPPPPPSSRTQPPGPPPVDPQDAPPSLSPGRDQAAPPPRRGPDNGPPAPGVRGFRDIAADADDLGRAASQANRAARKT